MESRCWRCGSVQPYSAAKFRNAQCSYCAADLHRPPMVGRVRWAAHPPLAAPTRRPKIARLPYYGPPRYPQPPLWGFAPSIWRSVTDSPPQESAAPTRELRTVSIFSRAAAGACLLAAGFESWRYVLLLRGRTEVLNATLVKVNDALVAAAGWSALLFAVAAAIALIPALGRAADFAAHRAGTFPARRPAQRLAWLLIPGWNLYGAGAVFAELDGLLSRRIPAPAPDSRKRTLRWRSSELPDVGGGSASPEKVETHPTETPAAAEPAPIHLRPGRLISWWWASWVLNGLIAAAVIIRSLLPRSLQAEADLVELHVLLNLVGCVVGALSGAVMARWVRLIRPATQPWPAGWILQPDPRFQKGRPESTTKPAGFAAQATGSGEMPRPTTESISG